MSGLDKTGGEKYVKYLPFGFESEYNVLVAFGSKYFILIYFLSAVKIIQFCTKALGTTV